MSEVTTYAGCFVPVSASRGENLSVKGRVINDTDVIYDGNITRNRLMPSRFKAYCNTYTTMREGARAHIWFKGSTLSLRAAVEQKECTVRVLLGKEELVTEAHSGIFLQTDKLSGEQKLEIEVLSGELLFDCAIIGGRGEVTFIGGANPGYVTNTAGFTRKDFGIVGGAGERAEIWALGKWATLTLNGEGRVAVSTASECRHLNIDCQRRVHFNLANDGKFNFVRIEVEKGSIELERVELSDTTTVVSLMNKHTDSELDDMHKGTRGYIHPDTWKPVHCYEMPKNGVTLDGGVLKKCFDKNITYLKDSLKKPRWVDFKDDDRIWIDMLVASNEGRMLVGMGNTLRYREVPEFRKAVREMLDEVERRQFTNRNGYCLPYESSLMALSNETWPHFMRDEIKNYDRTMFTKGLIAAGEAGFEDAWDIIRKFYDWFNNCEYLPDMLLGAMGIQGSAAGPRVYHSPAGKPEDIITNMKYYDMDWWLEYLAQGIPEAVWRFTLNRPHNYKLTSICALFDIYKATGEKKYLDAALGAYRIYRDYFMLPASFITICEHFECRPWTHFISNLPNSIFETCAGVFWCDLASRLLSADPDNEEYALQMEQSIFNLACACQGDDGKIRYFNQLDTCRYPALRVNTCCEIQGTGFIGQLPQFIYMLDGANVQINLFAPSTLKFNVDGKDITLKQTTSFPEGDTVRIRVSGDGRFTLRLRIPSWSKANKLTVCGEELACTSGSYAVIDRQWSSGDEVVLKTKRELKAIKYDGLNRLEKDRYCIMYGPILMCLKGELKESLALNEHEKVALLDMSPTELIASLERVDPLTYNVKGTDYQLVSYSSFTDNGYYTCFPAFNK